jgi:hypothetical protein
VCDQVRFTVEEWRSDPERCVEELGRTFGSRPVVVRSSAASEDGWAASFAGAYTSVLGVSPADPAALRDAISRVIGSFHRGPGGLPSEKDQVLVQPHVQNVALSGVLFTAGLDSGAPYLVINYDDTTSRTDTVTAGGGRELRTLVVYKHGEAAPADPRIGRLVEAARELEVVTGHRALDVEFAIDRDGELFILQVRPIAARRAGAGPDGDVDIRAELDQVRTFVHDRMQPIPHVHGTTTVFGDMPDWNPAEMIGTRPNPLALSLYQYLITDHAWCEARARIGYHDVFPERLMVSLAGHPYVDVRNSFNNLTPAGIPRELADRLIDHYLRRLRARPELHDKVEFEIVITCLSFDFEEHANRLRADRFGEAEIRVLREALFRLTDGVVSGRVEPVREQLRKVEELARRRTALVAAPYRFESIPRVVAVLLDDCVRFGTVPFSILARYAFIGSSLLRSLRQRGVLDGDEYHAFLEGIRTVAGDLVHDVAALARGELGRAEFLERYGHLRPGTYDILALSYEERPELYLPRDLALPEAVGRENPVPSFEPSPAQRERIAALVAEQGFGFTVDQLLGFIREAVSGREYAKFEFTRNVSRALGLLAELGQALGFTREEMAQVDIRDVLRLATDAHVGDVRAWLARAIAAGTERSARWRLVCLPPLITSVEDVEAFELPASRPNFVTGKRVVAPAVVLDRGEAPGELGGRIVMIESADPGFDWIFMHGIAGLITMYGGAASHMAIRCAEFGLPAAIGTGELAFNRLRGARGIELNCAAGYVRAV